MFVLGVDPGLSVTGYGLVRGGHPPRAVAAGVIRTDPAAPMESRLAELFDGLTGVLAESEAEVMAIETVFTNRNLQTAIAASRASGVALLAAAHAGIPVTEYVPTTVKAAVTGDGAAGKARVQAMVGRLLRLDRPPRPADVADALAVALCHLRAAPVKVGR